MTEAAETLYDNIKALNKQHDYPDVRDQCERAAKAVLSAVPSRPGGDAERVLDAAIAELNEWSWELPDSLRRGVEYAAKKFEKDRDRILREAGQGPDPDAKARAAFEKVAAPGATWEGLTEPVRDSWRVKFRSASVAGPGKEGAR